MSLVQCTYNEGEEPTLEEAQRNEFWLSGTLNGSFWEGRIFDTYVNEAGELILNAQIESLQRSIDIEQITVYVPGFDGIGSYKLEDPGGLYREWCCGDLLLRCSYTHTEFGDSGKVEIDAFDPKTGTLSGQIEFTASQRGDCQEEFSTATDAPTSGLIRFEEGTFRAKLVE